MTRKVFYSFHYKPDNWRVSQVRQMGVLEGNQLATDNDWEEITEEGDAAIETWIAGQLKGKSCCVVLIGANTASRKWVKHEIKEAWNGGKGVVGVYVHGLKNSIGEQATKGSNPFDSLVIGDKKLSSIVKAYNPPYTGSAKVYEFIDENLADWVEEAITIKDNHSA